MQGILEAGLKIGTGLTVTFKSSEDRNKLIPQKMHELLLFNMCGHGEVTIHFFFILWLLGFWLLFLFSSAQRE